MAKWYKNLYRRSLVDMHIADWDEKFLSEFDVDRYFETLKMGKIQSPMIYLQAHTGISNYPTKSGKIHNAFKNSPYKIRDLIEKCKKGGMTPVGYYSLIFNNFAEDNHPSWAMVNEKGENWRSESGKRYGLCCPNNEEYRKFLDDQIREISEVFSLDAIFYDMPYWEMFCHCPSCKKKWEEKYHVPMPEKQDFKDENYLHYIRMRQIWMGEFVEYVKALTKKYMPNTTVEFNYAAIIGCDYKGGSTELINDGCEFASGDLYGDLYSHSFACKYYRDVTKNQPFEYMTSRCDPNLYEHTVLKSQERLEREILLTAAHHGASLIIDAIDPVGTLDTRVYKRLGKAFEKQIPHEKFFKGELLSDVAVFFDSQTQFNSENLNFYNKLCAVNATRKIIANHILVNVISNSTLNKLNNYKLVIAPALEDFENDNILKFIKYVEDGGNLILTGKSESRLMKEFFDGEFKGNTLEEMTYIRPTEKGKKYLEDFEENYPLPVKHHLPVYELSKDIEVLGKVTLPATNPNDNSIFASIHSNPPFKKTDIVAIAKKKYKKGNVIWIASPIENDNRDVFEHTFINMVKDLLPQSIINLSCSKKVEATLFKDENSYILHFVDLYEDEQLERDFSVKINIEGKVKRVYYGENEKDILYKEEDGVVSFKGKFKTFTTIIVEIY